MAKDPLQRFTNNSLGREFWTGIDDDHLASVAFANYAWNIVERKFVSLVWIAADWTQKVGEVVTESTSGSRFFAILEGVGSARAME